ncbi:hypothetical protein N7478_006297 [Penicillium angulare]|uniref:uncharacterized protein n=1 Tax=Penicillium angulare TaxID=116970 RepID=UPI0025415984|nr:uncharacterized protein N7478_006297 [Penicillium angulare]KAJ5280925.1 hypothetical protein N7478_006297 [Penicillium angulare]
MCDHNVPSAVPGSRSASSSTSQPTDLQSNLDELAAPPPVYDTSERPVRQHDYLENHHSRHDGNTLQQAQEAIPDPDLVDTSRKTEKRPLLKIPRLTYTIGYLIFFSFVGTILRLAIECLTFYPGSPVNTSVLWANVGGSLIMGFLSEDQELFRIDESNDRQSAMKHKKTIPLFIGLTTGFCGSLTSFSTFIRDVFLALSNDLPVPLGSYQNVSLFSSAPFGASAPNGGFSFMALVAVLLTEIGLSLSSLILGAHLAIGTSACMPTLSQWWIKKIINPIVFVVAISTWIIVICLAALLAKGSTTVTLWSTEMWRGPALFALVFAPLGTLVRFFVSLKLNARIASFPLGTFIVNVGGTMVLGMAYSLQHASVSGASFAGCQVLQGIMDGFCGCLTTVSTWVLELSSLRKRHAYLYAVMSVAVALCALVVEIGSLKWTRGLVTPSCFRGS